MTDTRGHPLFRNFVEKLSKVEDDIRVCVTLRAGEVAIAALEFEKAIERLPPEQTYLFDAILSELKEAAMLIPSAASSNASLLLEVYNSVSAIVAKAVEAEARAQLRADCHSLADKEVRQKVWDLTGGRCTYCDCQLENGGTVGASFVVEHVVPRSCGGPDNIANYVPACSSCNNSKGDRHVLQFIQTKMDRRRPPLVVVPVAVASGE